MPPAPNVPLTEKLLISAGGWEAIKHGRALREAGRVSEARWTPPVLQGLVREGDRDYRAGLKILSASNVENLCTCRQSREWGTICAHSLAVGLAIVAGQTPAPAAAIPQRSNAPLPPPLPFRADPAAPARLHVVLAPDLAAAWAKNQLLVGLELAAGGQRTLLTPSPGAPKALLPEDYGAIEALAQIIGAVPGGMSFLSRDQFAKFLGALRDHPRVTAGKSTTVRIDRASFRPPLTAKRRDDGALDLEVRLPEGSKALTGAGDAWLLRPGAASFVLQAVSPGLPAAYQALFIERTRRLPKDQAAAFLSLEWPRLEAFFELNASGAAPVAAASVAGKDAGWEEVSGVTPGEPRFELSIEGSLQQIGARLLAVYPNKRLVTVGVTPERDVFTYPASEGKLHTRNLESERSARARLADLGFRGPDTTGHSFLRGEEAVLRFFSGGLPLLQKDAAWTVTIGSRFQSASRQIEVITPEIAVRGSGEDWFDLEVSFAGASGERFPASEIQRLLQMGKGHARLRNGKLALLPGEALNDFAEVLRDCDPTQPAPGVYRMARGQTAYLDATFQKAGWAATPAWEQIRAAGVRRPPDPELPPDLRKSLRGYQWEGVRWLHFLAANSLGGILADEMGLGKTLQALAFLASAAGGKPSLVVCPTSLVENWRREAARFTPKLKTLAIDGPDRAPLLRKIGSVDLAITSYALLRRDLPHYRALDFSTVILDEAHQIKNPDSQIAQAACALQAEHRFVLTGTPMENSVRDLWSVMHFAMPGYLGSREDFRERYELPLSRGGEEETRNRLSRRLRPVLLRRLKRDVAAELPERIEQTAFCDLTPAQADVYAQLLAQSRLKLDTARREKNAGQGRMLVLTALLRLRQACCDLRLLGLADSVAPEEDTVPSAKLALLDELLEEVVEGGHRVLIFSQFVSMLKILSEHLDKREMSYCYLDGSTKPKDRTTAVERFQNDASVTAFLISVKAGGVGLNLTGADTVIHFDPWWNPAVEAQATDRAHRIGQTRVVTAYRLIARGTVEEKIFALQNRKKELTASLVEREKDEPLLETLSFAEIESLLE